MLLTNTRRCLQEYMNSVLFVRLPALLKPSAHTLPLMAADLIIANLPAVPYKAPWAQYLAQQCLMLQVPCISFLSLQIDCSRTAASLIAISTPQKPCPRPGAPAVAPARQQWAGRWAARASSARRARGSWRAPTTACAGADPHATRRLQSAVPSSPRGDARQPRPVLLCIIWEGQLLLDRLFTVTKNTTVAHASPQPDSQHAIQPHAGPTLFLWLPPGA